MTNEYRAVSQRDEKEEDDNGEDENKDSCEDGSVSTREVSKEPTTPWPSIYTAGACSFAQAAQFSIFFSSMWPYLRKLNPHAKETQFGYIVALYSLGQCISAPSFGYWSNRIEQVRIPLLAGFCFMMAGNTLYLSLEFFAPAHVAVVMMVARFVAGCGTGNMSLLRAYASTSSCIADRARAIACVSGGIATGAMIGPAFQLFFTPLGHDGIYVLPFYRLNIYNSPALFSLLLNIAGFLVMFFAFEENYDVLRADAAKTPSKLPSPCAIAIFVSVFTRFVQIFSTTTIETLVLNRRAAASSYYEMIILDFLRLGSAFSMLMFSFNNEQAVTANATAHLIAGALGVTLYFLFIIFNLTKWVPPRLSSIVCLCAYAGLFVSTYSWPFLPNKVEISVNGSEWGCFSDRFDWCDGLTEVSPWASFVFIEES
ncbi:hypothetical protein Y032_0124g1249 [Ancylostoma ceylanicum]|uniref:Major facilitator superfamily (MFS) profile domain-containing protein n=1 Tax=Ancylostoma ceylanicum TaxID=53326 RepID=A0A016T9G1_9BILA|nr:hypothetical protein Y032_0124g1249 [Ancylostoma ceylanicum]